MTNPTLTYGHGYMNDMDDASDWAEVETGLSCTATSLYFDILKLTGICDDAGDEYATYTADITDISSSTYTKCLVHWKTSESINGCGARVQLEFDDASTQWILGETTPQFSQQWQLTSETVTTGKTIDKIHLYADDYPDGAASDGTSYVYYDYVLLCKNIFTFPYVTSPDGNARVQLDLDNEIAELHPPGMMGSHTQEVGLKNPVILLNGTMDSNTSWGTPYGQHLYYIWLHVHEDPWQWFTSDLINCKVLPKHFSIAQDSGVDALRTWNAELMMYNKSGGGKTEWKDNIEWVGHDWE